MTFGFDTRWGDTVVFEGDYSAQSLVSSTVTIEGNDLINVPGRGQPRVFLATWIWNNEISEATDPVVLDTFYIDWFIGVGQTNLRTRTVLLASRITPPDPYIKLPAETLRARFGATIFVPANPAAERRTIKLNMTLICGPYFPFGNEERQSIRGGY